MRNIERADDDRTPVKKVADIRQQANEQEVEQHERPRSLVVRSVGLADVAGHEAVAKEVHRGEGPGFGAPVDVGEGHFRVDEGRVDCRRVDSSCDPDEERIPAKVAGQKVKFGGKRGGSERTRRECRL